MAAKLPLIEGLGAGPSWLGTSWARRCGVLTQRALFSLPKRSHLRSQAPACSCGSCLVPAPLFRLLHPHPRVLGSIHRLLPASNLEVTLPLISHKVYQLHLSI